MSLNFGMTTDVEKSLLKWPLVYSLEIDKQGHRRHYAHTKGFKVRNLTLQRNLNDGDLEEFLHLII